MNKLRMFLFIITMSKAREVREKRKVWSYLKQMLFEFGISETLSSKNQRKHTNQQE